METQLIQSAPCPLCGEVAFAVDDWPPGDNVEYACLWEEPTALMDVHLHPCECTGCGNIQMVPTRS